MAFWKKSDDPWDRKPAKPTYTAFEEEPKKQEKGFFESIREDVTDWQEKKKTAAEAEANMPAEICPWCGKEMDKGYLSAQGGGSACWTPTKPGAFFGTTFAEESVLITDEGGSIASYKLCWYCRDCNKMTMTVYPPKPNYVWENGKVVLPEEENHDL